MTDVESSSPEPEDFAQSSASRHPEKSRRFTPIAYVAIVILITIAVAIVIAIGISRTNASGASTATVMIDQPTPTAVVNSPVRVSGRIDSLPQGNLLWLVIRDLEPQRSGTYQPVDHSCLVDSVRNVFDCGDIYLGGQGNDGEPYQIIILSADRTAVDAFLQYQSTRPAGRYPGLAQLPQGAVEAAQIRVTRQ